MDLYFDGGCKPNPGEMELAVISDCGTVKIYERIGYGTNNVAEWMGFLAAVQHALSVEGKHRIIGDSKLVVSQANGVWQVKKPELMEYKAIYDEMVKGQAGRLTITHVLRDRNKAGIFLDRKE
jgi:ribonuclease HI